MNQRKPEEVISDFFEVTERRAGNCVKALDAADYVIVPKDLPESWRHTFNRYGNYHPDDKTTKLLWRDLAEFMSSQTQK